MIRLGDIFTSFQNISHNQVFILVLQILITFSPLILASILLLIFWPLWKNYVQSSFIASLKYTLLEIKLPRELMKSPAAMEIFLNSLHNTADGNKIKQYWDGEMRPIFSLELVSVEGVVKFFIRTEDKRKAGVISALYSQFPEVEINEVDDYTKSIHFDPKESKMWGADFKFTMPDPYPIKTYIDYGLDKDPKEEFKVDPLVPMLEFLGSVGPNQQVWIQYIIKAHNDTQKKSGHWFKKTDAWKDEAKDLVNKLMARDPKTKVTDFLKLPKMSEGETDIVKAIERSVTKHPFDVGIRAIYIGKKDIFDAPFGLGGIISSFKHFSTQHLNGFKPDNKKWVMKIEYPWQDYKNIRKNKQCRLLLEAYKRRCYFYEPFKSKPMVLNSEELATIFHFPGQVAGTPTLTRIPSKKSEAPANLPI
ncbi:MAG: hypothetical protein AAB637_02260 [Patescibacteria group bacterium]